MRYFIYKDNQQQGPYTVEELLNHGLTSETLVWTEGMEQWTPAWQIKELNTILTAHAMRNGTSSPPPIPPVNMQQTESEQPQTEDALQENWPPKRTSGCMVAAITGGVIALVALLVLVFTCPNKEAHRDAIANEVNKIVDDQMGQTNDQFAAFGKVVAAGIVNTALDQMLRVDNYVVFSIGKIHYMDKTKKVSFGILGHVYTFDADDLEKAMDSINSQGTTMPSLDDTSNSQNNEDSDTQQTDDQPVDNQPETEPDSSDFAPF